ncbi:MAG: hypothetical protein ISS50_00640 [Anaerolineae bacterium]|nr:hypothetical protein [Anaerolineae bacterium]
MVRAGLKGGIIMGMVAAVANVISYVAPELACFLSLLRLVLWFATGILAARFGATAALTTGEAAGAGALAGAITQIISRIADGVMNLITLALGLVSVPFSAGTMQWLAYLALGPHDIVESDYQIVPLQQIAYRVDVSYIMFCVGVSIAIAAVLGAVGGILGRVTSGDKGS